MYSTEFFTELAQENRRKGHSSCPDLSDHFHHVFDRRLRWVIKLAGDR
jgi:hypothetical protein